MYINLKRICIPCITLVKIAIGLDILILWLPLVWISEGINTIPYSNSLKV